MRLYKTITLLVGWVTLTATLHAEEKNGGKNDPKSVVGAWVATFNDNDVNKLLAFYEQSSELEVIASSGNRYDGYDAIKKGFADDMENVRFYESKAKAISARRLGGVALVSFEHQFKMVIQEDGSKWQFHIRTTSVLNRVDGDWRITQEHSSAIRGIDRLTRIDD